MAYLNLNLRFVDQNGNEIEDRAIRDTALAVYNVASEEFINPYLIPSLNDVLYDGREFPLGDKEQKVYEDHGFRMMEVAYEFTAYTGVGRCGDYLVYPIEVLIHGEEGDAVHDSVMRCVVKPL